MILSFICKRYMAVVLMLSLLLIPMQAQDGLNLPTELYILLNDGQVEQYGLGVSGRTIVTPEDEFVLDFRVAPDGNWIAYRTQTGLYMRHMYENLDPIALPVADVGVPYKRGQGETIAWTPDSTAIALTTLTGGYVYFLESQTIALLDTPNLLNVIWSPTANYLLTQADDGVWWVFRRDSETITLTSAITEAIDVAWFNETQLVFTPPTGGLIIMDLVNANTQTPLLDASTIYRLPKRTDSGTLLVYRMDNSDPAQGTLLELTFTDTTPLLEEVTSEPIDLTAVQWAPGTDWLVAFQGGALALINARGNGGFTLPITSTSAYGWGAITAPISGTLDVSTSVTFIAPDAEGINQVWQISPSNPFPETITPATEDVRHYALSLNGQFVAYVSGGGLWVYPLDGSEEPQQLVELNNSAEALLAFSPDNGVIFYRDQQDTGSGIWRLEVETGQVSLFVLDTDVVEYKNPRPSAFISAMVIETVSETPERNGLSLVDTVSGEVQFLGNFTQGIWLDNSEILVEGIIDDMPFPALHIIDVNAVVREPQTILPITETFELLDVVGSDANTLTILAQQTNPGTISVLDVERDGASPTIRTNIGYVVNPKLAPDGESAIGYTHRGGTLLWIDIETNERNRLARLTQVQNVRWQAR